MHIYWTLVFLALHMFTESLPVSFEMVDMTHVFDNTTLHPPTHHKFELKVIHNGTVDNLFWLQMEEYKSNIHVGTHMDAPCHTTRGAICVDKIPIERFVAPAAVVDVVEQAEADRDYLVQPEDLQRWESLTGKNLNDRIVLIRTGWGRKWSDKTDFIGNDRDDEKDMHYPGMSEEACRWLVSERQPVALGVETFSLDYGPTRNNIAHQVLLGANLYGLECVANMDKIPIDGATLFVSPMKIGNASGAPVRIFATFPKFISPEPDS